MTLRYLDGERETLKVVAHSPEESLHFAMMKSSRKDERPVEVTSKNKIGAIVGKIAAKTTELAKKGFEFTRKGVKAGVSAARGLHAGLQGALDTYQNLRNPRLNSLIRRAYSPNVVTRTKARGQLKAQYPDIYVNLERDLPPPTERVREIIREVTRKEEEKDLTPKEYDEIAKRLAKDVQGGKSNPGNPKKLSAQKQLEKEIAEAPTSALPYKILYKKPGIYVKQPIRVQSHLIFRRQQ